MDILEECRKPGPMSPELVYGRKKSMRKIVTQIKTKDYDRIKKGDEVVLVVEATNREPMKIFASIYSLSDDTPDHSGYENAVFNGECH